MLSTAIAIDHINRAISYLTQLASLCSIQLDIGASSFITAHPMEELTECFTLSASSARLPLLNLSKVPTK